MSTGRAPLAAPALILLSLAARSRFDRPYAESFVEAVSAAASLES